MLTLVGIQFPFNISVCLIRIYRFFSLNVANLVVKLGRALSPYLSLLTALTHNMERLGDYIKLC